MTKVLVIDDEKLIRDRMQKLLELDDYEVFIAENGHKGLEILEEEHPEIVLVDILMPGMDGIEVSKRIKDTTTETAVIIITGHVEIQSAIKAIKIGVFGYIQKPIVYDELEIEIKRAIEKQELRKKAIKEAFKEANGVLKVLLRQRDKDKKELEDSILFNLKELAEPIFNQLKDSRLSPLQRDRLDLLEIHLNDIVSPFTRRLSAEYRYLTPAELKVATHIKYGKTSKEIAQSMHLSVKTIESYRKMIRKKMGLTNRKVNLRIHLMSIQSQSMTGELKHKKCILYGS